MVFCSLFFPLPEFDEFTADISALDWPSFCFMVCLLVLCTYLFIFYLGFVVSVFCLFCFSFFVSVRLLCEAPYV